MASNDNTEWYRLLFEKEQWSQEERRRLLEYLDEGEDEELRRLMEERFRQDGVGAPTHSEAEGRLLALIHEKIRPPGKRVRLYT